MYCHFNQLCACICHFDDNKTTIETVIQLLQNNIPLSRIEFLDSLSIAAANEYSKVGLPVKPSLFLEISGNQADIEPVVKMTREIVEENGGGGFQHSTAMEERSKLWKARHELYYACKSTRPGHRTIITDVCVPISKLTDIILQMQTYFDKYTINGISTSTQPTHFDLTLYLLLPLSKVSPSVMWAMETSTQ